MNLEDISEEYQKNLVSFFHDERIIEHIYKEQYGEKNYKLHEEEYKKQYKEIIDNTVFVPYITLEGIEHFLKVNFEKYGDNYVKEKYSDIIKLCIRLNAKKKSIIEQYTELLIGEIENVVGDFDVDRKKLSNTDFKCNSKLISNSLNLDGKSIRQYLRKKKVDKIIKKFENVVNDKIIVETTSYYKHRRDFSDGKYYTSALDDIRGDGGFVRQAIGKDTKKNCRYIYLPVMTYRNTRDYLTFALHEVMHISKEKIGKNCYQTGLLVRGLSHNKKSSILHMTDKKLENISQSVYWILLKLKNHKKIDSRIYYDARLGDIQMEEAIHHWQACKVADAIIKDGLDSMLNIPYCINLPDATKVTYERLNKVTKKFMDNFKEDIHKINSGEESIKKFKSKVGYENYGMLSTLYQVVNPIDRKEKKLVIAGRQSYKVYTPGHTKRQDCTELGDEVIKKMKKSAEKYDKRKNKGVKPSKVHVDTRDFDCEER